MRRLARAGGVGWLFVCTAVLPAAWSGAPATELAGDASRTLPPCYEPGSALTVAIAVAPDPEVDVFAQVVTDTPPAGWTPGTISHGGTWDPIAQRVRWGPFSDSTARMLTYGVTPPPGAGGSGSFTGIVTFDGVETPVGGHAAVGPCERNPADSNRDWRVVIGEVTGYAAAWKRGLAWDVPPVPIPIGHVTRAGFLWRGGETYRTEVGACPLCWAPATGQTVGPEGGRLEFSNGIVLEVPPGAVNLPTLIEITGISCAEADAVLSLPRYATHQQRCLGGFRAKPEGLWFNVPVTAIVPVQPLLPSEIPVQGHMDLVAQTQGISATDLTYRGDAGLAEIRIQHFSDTYINGLRHYDDPAQCTTAECEEGRRLHTLCSQCTEIANPECVGFDKLQPPCCLLYPKDRTACAGAACDCCREKEIHVTTQEADFTARGCQIAAGEVEVTFPQCANDRGVPITETYKVGEAEGCPPDMKYEVAITPSPVTIYACQEEHLAATLSGTGRDGKMLFRPATVKPFWKIAPEAVAVVDPRTDKVKGNPRPTGTDGQATITAVVSPTAPEIKGSTTITVKPYGAMRLEAVSPPGGTSSAPEVPVEETVPLRAIIDGLCGGPPLEPCPVTLWDEISNAYATVDATGLVTGKAVGHTIIEARYQHCEQSFSATIAVRTVPAPYVMKGKLGDCEWDAPFCYFNSISAPLPLTVRLTWPDGRPIARQEVFVSVQAPRSITPAQGQTNDDGEFQAAITGVPAYRPYVIAYATADVGSRRKNVEVRAITDDFCVDGVLSGQVKPFGTVVYPGRHEGAIGVSATSCTEVGNACVTGSASVTDPCEAMSQMWTGGALYSDSHNWWDTVLVVPKDLSELGRTGALDLSFTNQRTMSAVSVGYGFAMNQVDIYQPGVAVEEESGNYGPCNSIGRTFLYEQDNFGTYQPTRCFIGKSRLGGVTIGAPVRLGASLSLILSVNAYSVPTPGGGCDLSTASVSTSVSQGTAITGVTWFDNLGVSHPLDAWIFSCSGKFTTPR